MCIIVNYGVCLLQVLKGVHLHVSELLKTVFGSLSLDNSVLHNVMATVLAAILAEMSFYSQQVRFIQSWYLRHKESGGCFFYNPLCTRCVVYH